MMKLIQHAALCSVVIAITAFSAQAQNATPVPAIEGSVYVVTFVSVAPSAIPRAIEVLTEYRDEARSEPGATYINIYEEQGESHRFVIREVWQNDQALRVHLDGNAVATLTVRLAPIRLGPRNRRIHRSVTPAPPRAPTPDDVLIISSISSPVDERPRLIELLNQVAAASRSDAGLVNFRILEEVPVSRGNFRILEEWSDSAVWESHALAEHTQAYREAILPLLDSIYDQRVYSMIE